MNKHYGSSGSGNCAYQKDSSLGKEPTKMIANVFGHVTEVIIIRSFICMEISHQAHLLTGKMLFYLIQRTEDQYIIYFSFVHRARTSFLEKLSSIIPIGLLITIHTIIQL